MHIYYFDKPLSEEDLAFVLTTLESAEAGEQIRIPHVLPAEMGKISERIFRRHETLQRAALRNAGIARDRGKQVALVAPGQLYWNSTLMHAVYAETGAFPWLIQTREQREAIGNPGETRILDMRGAMVGLGY
jgi:hypothetical protein